MIRCELSLGRRIKVIPALIVLFGDCDVVRNVFLNAIIDINEFRVIPIQIMDCLLYTSPSPRDKRQSRMPSSA